MAKSKAKHYPPAYHRYRESHPTVSIVLSKDTKEALDTARGELSYAKFLTSLISPDGAFSQFEKQRAQMSVQKLSLESEKKRLETVKKNLEIERKKIEGTERFLLPCAKCRTPMLFENTDDNWNSKIKPALKKTFSGYICGDCQE